MLVTVIVRDYNKGLQTTKYDYVDFPVVPRIGDVISLPTVEGEGDPYDGLALEVSRVEMSPNHPDNDECNGEIWVSCDVGNHTRMDKVEESLYFIQERLKDLLAGRTVL